MSAPEADEAPRHGEESSGDAADLLDCDTEWRTLGPDRFESGEGGRWGGSTFWQVDLLAGKLLRGAAGWRRFDLVIDAGRPVGCLVPTERGYLVLLQHGFPGS